MTRIEFKFRIEPQCKRGKNKRWGMIFYLLKWSHLEQYFNNSGLITVSIEYEATEVLIHHN